MANSRSSAAQTAASLDDHVFDPRYPMHADRRERWAKAHGYKLSQRHYACLYALAGQTHSPCHCCGGIIDHCETWLRAGQLSCITAQPYESTVSPNDLERLQTLCLRLGLHVSIFRNQNWYNDIRGVLLIVIERADLNDEVR
jgi:hypothetical protein